MDVHLIPIPRTKMRFSGMVFGIGSRERRACPQTFVLDKEPRYIGGKLCGFYCVIEIPIKNSSKLNPLVCVLLLYARCIYLYCTRIYLILLRCDTNLIMNVEEVE